MLKFSRHFKSRLYSKHVKSVDKYSENSLRSARFTFLRVASDILILGEGKLVVFGDVFEVLTQKLKEKGFILKDIEKPILEFKSETYFDYLGFRFFYKGFKKEKLILGQFALKNRRNLLWVAYKKFCMKSTFGFVVSIHPESFRNCCAKIREIFSRFNSRLFVDELLRRYNHIIKGIVKYFGITFNTRNQLRSLDNLSYC